MTSKRLGTLRVITIPKCSITMSKLKTEGNNGLSSEKHPLLQPQIIRKILNYLSLKEIKLLRLLCKNWNKETCQILQSKKLVTFKTGTEVAKYTELFNPTTISYPHEKFHFSKIRMNLIYDNYVFRKFFRQFSMRIKHLQLDLNGQNFRMKFLRMCILESVPFLESLELNFKDFHEIWPWILGDDHPLPVLDKVTRLKIAGPSWDNLSTILFKLVECVPNLESLVSIRFFSENFIDRIRNLTHLDLQTLSQSDITLIVLLPLKTLKAVLDKNVQESEVKKLLDGLSPTLEELQLESTKQLCFPHDIKPMGCLRLLEISHFQFDLSILKKFFQLTDAKFRMTHFKINFEAETTELITLQKMHSLKLEMCQELSPTMITTLSKICPNLCKLYIPVHIYDTDENIFGPICENMVNLEELIIFQDTITDAVLTGIPDKICREIMEALRFGQGTLPSSIRVQSLRCGPWIGLLTKLRVLELKSIDISDVAVLYGVINCKGLQSLKLHSPYWMTNVSLRAIADTIVQNLTSLDLLCSNQITDSAVNYLKHKMNGRKCLIAENQLSPVPSSDSS